MVAALTLIVGSNRWQAAQLELSAQGINDPQHVFKSQSGLASLKVDDEAHANPGCEGQLGLCQPELLASSTECIAELLR
jgi:hypothetical protein